MAISQVGFGLKPINKVGSNYNAAQVSEYRSFSPSYEVGFQAPVTAGYGAIPKVQSVGYKDAKLTGSFVGCQYVSKTTGKPVFADNIKRSDLPTATYASPGNFNGMFSTFITDDPYQLFLMKIDGDLTVSNIIGNYQMNASGQSSDAIDGTRSIVKLDSSTRAGNSSNPLKFMHFGTGLDDISTREGQTGETSQVLQAGSNVVVMLNNAKLKPGTARF